jgi:pimeloyl-ACP methyl ester carboxylesterase
MYEMPTAAREVRAIRGVIVSNSGHWIPEEQPQFVIKQFVNFLGSNGSTTTNTSK